MQTIKERLKKIIDDQPDDASYEEILREMLFDKMIDRGLQDSKENRTISNKEMEHRIKTW